MLFAHPDEQQGELLNRFSPATTLKLVARRWSRSGFGQLSVHKSTLALIGPATEGRIEFTLFNKLWYAWMGYEQ